MLVLARIIVCSIAFVAMLIWSVDFIGYLKNRYCRYHIGRWKDELSWKEAVTQCAIRWTKHTPTVKITDNNRYLLMDMLQGKYRSQTIQSWQTASLMLGLEQCATDSSTNAVRQMSSRLITENGMFRNMPTNVDVGMLCYSLLQSSDPVQIKPAMDYAVELIVKHIAEDGTILYTNDLMSDERYVDTIGLVCPFLARYGRIYGKSEYIDLAVNQLEAFIKYGLDSQSGLPNHAYSVKTKLPLGVYGWGRGAGWYTLGLIDTYQELPECPARQQLKEQIKKTADQYLRFQRDDGGFGHILQLREGYDSSATAALAYFYKSCANVFHSPTYAEVSKKCINKLKSVTRITGAVDWCQGDTKGIGVFSQTYDVMPFAQGLVLRSIYMESV